MVFKLSTTCLIIWLIILLNNLLLVESLPNQKRWAHAASLVDNYLYIYGGRIAIPGESYDSLDPDYDTDEILYLDVSVGFNSESPNWKSITGIAPPLAFHSMSIGGESNELLIIFGGTSKHTIPSNPLYIFNTTSSTNATNSPTTVNVKGSIEHTSITRYNDSMVFIFGGTSQIITNANATDVVAIDAFNDMHVLDSKSITFNTISPSNGLFPLGIYHHSSTLLSDNKIYIIGGADKNDALMPMKSINIFDTMTNQWSNQNAEGTIPIERRVHRAVGTKDNKIIIYGGCNKDYSTIYSDLIVLDTTTLQWSAPTTQGTPPPQMYAHTMTMVGTNVIIAFGFINGFNATQDIYILDSTNYTWMPTYVPNNLEITNTKPTNNDPSSSPSLPSSSLSSSSSNQIGVIVGSIIGSLAAIFLIIVLVICIRKRRKRNGSFFTKPYEQNQPSVPPIPGTIPYNQLPTTVNDQDPARQLPPTMSQFVSKSNAGSDKGSTATNHERNESYYNDSSRNSSKTNSNRFSVVPYLDNPYCVDKDTTDPTPIVNSTSSSSSPSNKNLFNEHDYDDDNTKATSGINDLYGYNSQLNYSNDNSNYYSGKPQPPTPPSKYYDDDDDEYPQSNRLSASSSIYAPSRPNSPPSMNPPILPSSTDTSSFSSSNENNDETMRVTDNDYDNSNAGPIFSNEEAVVEEPRKIEKRAFSLRSAQKLSSTAIRPNKGTLSTTEETITEENL